MAVIMKTFTRLKPLPVCEEACKMVRFSHNPPSFKGKKASSQQWLNRQVRDPYVKRAALEHWRCRSAFKLIEIDNKYNILKPGHIVIDCGACPGSWSQVAVKRVNSNGEDKKKPEGVVIGIDLQPMAAVPGAITIPQSDFTTVQTQKKILHLLQGKKADVVMSDMAPNATGHLATDHQLIVHLCAAAFQFAQVVLSPGGTFLCKLWQGTDQKKLEDAMKCIFRDVRVVKPPSSRSDSAEIFVLGRTYSPKHSH